ncbi:formate dehydrogenase subunit gamma [Azospirillum halopraeferens]|uniref:formate dehydrogenase subunit gamma n=1 Tax=Azospirillum halopraeferens TaxID=34010 RepID=UPI000416BB94|nr:formate dehydrogenase subunit gamma [Azospirillum halopraeferens]
MTTWFKTILAALLLSVAVAGVPAPPALAQSSSIRLDSGGAPPPPPTQSLDRDQAEMWRAIRMGETGNVSAGGPVAGVLIQSDGELWRSLRNGPVADYGALALAGVLGVLVLFFLLRGRIRIDGAKTGRTIERFNTLERASHWLTAGSFVVLALTGLNILYGRHTLLPLIGPEAFAQITMLGKLAHNYLGFAFMLGVLLTFLLWVRHNLPDRTDIGWALRAGGLFSRGVHPPAKKFNAGQKLIFWSTVVGGGVLGFTGLQLLFPLYFGSLADMQLYQLIHAGTALLLSAIIIGHIYIGSIGMEGAFDAMGNGQVEEQWAREHHSLWVAEVKGEPPPTDGHGHGHGHGRPGPAPAE